SPARNATRRRCSSSVVATDVRLRAATPHIGDSAQRSIDSVGSSTRSDAHWHMHCYPVYMIRARALAATAVALVVAMFVATGCFHQPDTDELVKQRVVVTKFDPKIDFKSFATFAMPTSIPVFSSFELDAGAAPQTADPAIATAIIDE